MTYRDIAEFQQKQKDTVSRIGAFLVNLEPLISDMGSNENESVAIRKLQPIVGEFIDWFSVLRPFLSKYHLSGYFSAIYGSAHSISSTLANQTMPSKIIEIEKFRESLLKAKISISEAMIAIAQIVTSPIDVNLVAGNSFSAYCFIQSLMDVSKSELYIIDPYLDKTIFHRYFLGLDKSLKIMLISDSRKLKGQKLIEFESVEELFKKEYPNYSRNMFNDLHDRYFINEVKAYNLGGSIIHAAFKSDYSIIEVSAEKRSELLAKYS